MVLRATVKEDVSLKREECNDLNAHDAELTSEERSYCERVTGKRCGNGAFEEFMPPAYISIEEEPDEYCHRDAMSTPLEFSSSIFTVRDYPAKGPYDVCFCL